MQMQSSKLLQSDQSTQIPETLNNCQNQYNTTIKSFFQKFFNTQNNNIQQITHNNQQISVTPIKNVQTPKNLTNYWCQLQKQFQKFTLEYRPSIQTQKKLLKEQDNIEDQFLNTFERRKNFYTNFFKDYRLFNLQNLWNDLILRKQNYKITKVPYHTPQIQVILRQHSDNYDIVQYQILLSYFKTTITLKNLAKKINHTQKPIGAGTFGGIFNVQLNQKQLVAKRLYFNQNQLEQTLLECIREYSVYKLASFLEIGPNIEFIDGVDILCFANAIQFYMEVCESPYQQNNQRRQEDLKMNLITLHKLKIVHRDIKPENTLFSRAFKKFILIDFGTSHPIKQEVNIKTYAGICGTLNYLPQSIQRFYKKNKNSARYLDLYYLDAYALLMTLKEFNNPLSIIKKQAYKPMRMHNYMKKINQINTTGYIDYSRFPELQKINFKIRIQGFNNQIQSDLNHNIEQIHQLQLQKQLRLKLEIYKQQFKDKQAKKFVWSKKCSKIQQHFINKGYQKIAQKMMLQRQVILIKNKSLNIRDTIELVQIWENLTRLHANYELNKSKCYLKKIETIIKNGQNNASDKINQKFQFIYQDLSLFIRICEDQPETQYQIYLFIKKYKNQPQIWRSIGRYAKPFAINNKLQKCREIYDIAIKIRKLVKFDKEMNQKQFLEEVQMQFNIAKIYSAQSKFQKAIQQAKIGLQMMVNRFRQNHKYYQISSFLYINIGYNYLILYQLSQSLMYLKKAQQIYMLNYGKNTFLSKTLNNIGLLYRLKGNFNLALQYQKKALDIRIQSAGQVSLTTAIVIRNIACTLLQKGDLHQSLIYFQKHQSIYDILSLKYKLQVLECKSQMLFIYIKLQNQQQIIKLITQMEQFRLQIKEEHLPSAYFQRMRSYNFYLKNYEYCQKSFEVSFKKISDNLYDQTKLYIDYLEFSIQTQNHQQSSSMLTKVRSLFEKLNEQNSYSVARYHYLFSKMLFQENQWDNCLQQLSKAIKLVSSYFEYHYDLIDYYILLLNIKITKKEKIKDFIEIKLKMEKIILYNEYNKGHSKLTLYESLYQSYLQLVEE